MTLAEKIRAEAQAERLCPTCGAERRIKRVWRDVDRFTRRGTLEPVCAQHGPFGGVFDD